MCKVLKKTRGQTRDQLSSRYSTVRWIRSERALVWKTNRQKQPYYCARCCISGQCVNPQRDICGRKLFVGDGRVVRGIQQLNSSTDCLTSGTTAGEPSPPPRPCHPLACDSTSSRTATQTMLQDESIRGLVYTVTHNKVVPP